MNGSAGSVSNKTGSFPVCLPRLVPVGQSETFSKPQFSRQCERDTKHDCGTASLLPKELANIISMRESNASLVEVSCLRLPVGRTKNLHFHTYELKWIDTLKMFGFLHTIETHPFLFIYV